MNCVHVLLKYVIKYAVKCKTKKKINLHCVLIVFIWSHNNKVKFKTLFISLPIFIRSMLRKQWKKCSTRKKKLWKNREHLKWSEHNLITWKHYENLRQHKIKVKMNQAHHHSLEVQKLIKNYIILGLHENTYFAKYQKASSWQQKSDFFHFYQLN